MSVLAALLRSHGVPVRHHDGWLVTSPGSPAWRCQVEELPLAHSRSVQLDVDLALPDGRMLTESFAGVGATLEAGVQNAFRKFSDNALHVLLSAFHGHHDPEQSVVETWRGAHTSWTAHVGPLQLVSTGASPMPVMPELVDLSRDLMETVELLERPHWLRIFRGQVNGGTPTLEVLLDNVTWVAPCERLQRLPWPVVEGYGSVRLFLVILPPSTAEAPVPFLPESESLRVGFDRLLAVAASEPEASDCSWYQALVADNVSPSVAERLIAFVPIAFGELLLAEAKHSPAYRLMNGGQPGPERKLMSEPAYAIAKEMADRVTNDPVQRAGLEALALRSACVNAANDALNRGSRLENLHFTPSVVFLGRFSPEPASAPAEPAPSPGETSPAGAGKPWWKFW